VRLSCARVGNRGKKYLRLFVFLVLNVLLILGFIYIIALQSNALFLEVIIAITVIIFAGTDLVLGLVLLIYYRAME
jgi:hypothetical protein